MGIMTDRARRWLWFAGLYIAGLLVYLLLTGFTHLTLSLVVGR
jgi:hypothetical protein